MKKELCFSAYIQLQNSTFAFLISFVGLPPTKIEINGQTVYPYGYTEGVADPLLVLCRVRDNPEVIIV